MIKAFLFVIVFAFFIFPLYSSAQPLHQKKLFTRQDSLRGTITPERAWWDVQHYDITVTPDFSKKAIAGKVVLTVKATSPGNRLQIDLQEPMAINSATWQDKTLRFSRDGNVYFIELPETLQKGSIQKIEIAFIGVPRPALRPPWDGGWIWAKDAQGRPWMSVACQGLGASVWYPCKDHQSDEPDNGASLTVIVPDTLVAIANGRLAMKEKRNDGQTAYTWTVTKPINNYNIIPYIGKYVNWSETYTGEKGKLDCSYWVLDYNLEKAKKQFTQVAQTLKAFEHWMGPYPFYEDGFKLVESPHLGMEHQTAVAYGNKFGNGYLGMDLSGTGWGKKWDYIIVHETGHEWFGNNITTNDIADMWVHEGFTDYTETLFTEYYYGKEAGAEYCRGLRRSIQNDQPIIGPYGVNQEGSGDMYYKGANLLHTIRQVFNDDELFRKMIRGLNKDFYHQTVTTAQVEAYVSKQLGKNLDKVFDQYLRTTDVPLLRMKKEGDKLKYRWENCVDGFNMPVKLTNGQWLTPSAQWQETALPKKANELSADPNFYIKVEMSN